MSYDCFCNIAAEFPITKEGIISAALRSSTNVTVTEGGVVLAGTSTGDLSITAYAPLDGEILECSGRAGASFTWNQRVECDPDTGVYMKTHFIPGGNVKSYTEGDITSQISMIELIDYNVFNASASSGPHTVYFDVEHRDGYSFLYSGEPITINSSSNRESMTISFLSNVLPSDTNRFSLYLANFSWEYTPPNIPIVSYSFLFSYTDEDAISC